MRTGFSQTFTNISATTAAFVVPAAGAGIFSVTVSATFGGGTVKLQRLAIDNVTWVDLFSAFANGGAEVDLAVASFTANGNKVLYLGEGQYRVNVVTATAVNVEILRIPGE
jgi:hypothetical protein